MLAKINKIKNLGLVFRDFNWSAETPSFKEVNLIYGWNGCGKTTLTRLFDEVAVPTQSSIDYNLELSDGASVRQGDSFPRQIRVFNQSYIENNVRILESKANTISVLLGEQNKELMAQIEAQERELNGDPSDTTKTGKLREFDGYSQKKVRKERGNETAFSDIARTIGAAIVGSGGASRTYRSPDAKQDFESLTLPSTLSKDELDGRILALKQEQLATLGMLELSSVSIAGVAHDLFEGLFLCHAEAERLCATTVEAETIARLRDNPDIAEWVEQGRRVHAQHNAANCEYCGGLITSERLSRLARHFSLADQQLKANIESLLLTLRGAYSTLNELHIHDAARLYGELQPSYGATIEEFATAKAHLADEIASIGKALQDKKVRTGEVLTLSLRLDTSYVARKIGELNEILKLHNTKSADFQKIKDEAVLDIKAYYLGLIYEDVTRRNAEIKELETDLERRDLEIKTIKNSIASARAAVSSTHKACQQINLALRTFLGHQELRFEPDSENIDPSSQSSSPTVGYRIMRGDLPAMHLSEGEKTAIAFVYFVVHMADGQFPKRDGIVVIDDPISSFDSNSLYQAFSFLKNAVLDCHQVFVLTHNFDFLKLLLNWRSRLRKRTGYYMIRNQFIDGERRASIIEMDRELQTYDSEYQYLFKTLKKMHAEQDGTLMRAYPVPNIARKVWDTFLMYRVPNNDNPYRKMDLLKEAGFDAKNSTQSTSLPTISHTLPAQASILPLFPKPRRYCQSSSR